MVKHLSSPQIPCCLSLLVAVWWSAPSKKNHFSWVPNSLSHEKSICPLNQLCSHILHMCSVYHFWHKDLTLMQMPQSWAWPHLASCRSSGFWAATSLEKASEGYFIKMHPFMLHLTQDLHGLTIWTILSFYPSTIAVKTNDIPNPNLVKGFLCTGKQVRLEGGLTSFWHRGSQVRNFDLLKSHFTKSSSSEKLLREIETVHVEVVYSVILAATSLFCFFLLILRKNLQVGLLGLLLCFWSPWSILSYAKKHLFNN
jgi:hypothetical protein